MKKKLLFLAIAFILFSGCTKKNTAQERIQMPTDQSIYSQLQPTPQPSDSASTDSQERESAEQSAVSKESDQQATQAELKTSKGSIIIELFPESTPLTVKNFVDKSQTGYYNNLTFHRVEDWVIQGGDPLGNGTGGGKMPTELSSRQFEVGSVGVARGGDIKVSNDSQFFICTNDCNFLTSQYTNFGKVVSGMDVAKNIAIGDVILGVTIRLSAK